MKNRINEFLKGIVIGIATMLPGFSGSVMAVSFGVYDRLITALSEVTKKPFKAFKDIWALGLGIFIGLVVAVLSIALIFDYFTLPAILLFVGLIIGSIPSIYNKIKPDVFKAEKIISFIMGILLIVGFLLLALYNPTSAIDVEGIDFVQLLLLFIVGVVVAIVMLIPGASVTLVLLSIGYYKFILDFFKAFLKALLRLDYNGVFNNLLLIAFLGLGALIGLISFSKVVKKLTHKFPKVFYSVVLGMLVVSPITIFIQLISEYKANLDNIGAVTYIISLVLFIIGFLVSYNITKEKEIVDENVIEIEKGV